LFPSVESGSESDQPVEQQQPKDEKVQISKTELESLHRQLKETRDSELSWATLARRGAQPQQEQAQAEPEETLDPDEFGDPDAPDIPADDTPDKMVADIAANGVKAIQQRGFVTAKDAQRIAVEAASRVTRELIGRERQKITTDAQLMNEFPDLRDQNSALFKETAVRFQKAIAIDPRASKTPAALYLAAQAAKESLDHQAAVEAAKRSTEDDGFEDEADRQVRVRSQAGRPSVRDAEDDDDMMGDQARIIARAMGVTDEQYKAQKKELRAQQGRSRR